MRWFGAGRSGAAAGADAQQAEALFHTNRAGAVRTTVLATLVVVAPAILSIVYLHESHEASEREAAFRTLRTIERLANLKLEELDAASRLAGSEGIASLAFDRERPTGERLTVRDARGRPVTDEIGFARLFAAVDVGTFADFLLVTGEGELLYRGTAAPTAPGPRMLATSSLYTVRGASTLLREAAAAALPERPSGRLGRLPGGDPGPGGDREDAAPAAPGWPTAFERKINGRVLEIFVAPFEFFVPVRGEATGSAAPTPRVALYLIAWKATPTLADVADGLNPEALSNVGLLAMAVVFLFPLLRVWFLELHDSLSRWEQFAAFVAVFGLLLVVALTATKGQLQWHAREQLDRWVGETVRDLDRGLRARTTEGLRQLLQDEAGALAPARCAELAARGAGGGEALRFDTARMLRFCATREGKIAAITGESPPEAPMSALKDVSGVIGWPIEDRRYFRVIRQGGGWLLAPFLGEGPGAGSETAPLDAAPAGAATPRRFFLDRVLNRLDGERVTQLSLSSADGAYVLAADLPVPEIEHGVQPAHQRFVVFDEQDGKVLFHSEDDRSLIDNLYLETGFDEPLMALVRSRAVDAPEITLFYDGDRVRGRYRPLAGTGLGMFVFYDLRFLESWTGVALLYAAPALLLLVFLCALLAWVGVCLLPARAARAPPPDRWTAGLVPRLRARLARIVHAAGLAMRTRWPVPMVLLLALAAGLAIWYATRLTADVAEWSFRHHARNTAVEALRYPGLERPRPGRAGASVSPLLGLSWCSGAAPDGTSALAARFCVETPAASGARIERCEHGLAWRWPPFSVLSGDHQELYLSECAVDEATSRYLRARDPTSRREGIGAAGLSGRSASVHWDHPAPADLWPAPGALAVGLIVLVAIGVLQGSFLRRRFLGPSALTRFDGAAWHAPPRAPLVFVVEPTGGLAPEHLTEPSRAVIGTPPEESVAAIYRTLLGEEAPSPRGRLRVFGQRAWTDPELRRGTLARLEAHLDGGRRSPLFVAVHWNPFRFLLRHNEYAAPGEAPVAPDERRRWAHVRAHAQVLRADALARRAPGEGRGEAWGEDDRAAQCARIEARWHELSVPEKLALYQLARGRRLNPKNGRIIQRLVDHRLVPPGPVPSALSPAASDFVQAVEPLGHFTAWERSASTGIWQSIQIPVVLLLVVLVGWLAYAAGDVFKSIAALVLGLTAVLTQLANAARMVTLGTGDAPGPGNPT